MPDEQRLSVLWIDDDLDLIKSISHQLRLSLGAHWSVETKLPPDNLAGCLAMLAEEEASVLIVDQRLSMKRPTCKYSGMDVARFVEGNMRYLPIIMVTGYGEDTGVLENEEHVLSVIDRNDLTKRGIDVLATRIKNLALFSNNKRLRIESELSALAKRISTGQASQDDAERADEITLSLSGRRNYASDFERSTLVDAGEELVQGLTALVSDIRRSLNGGETGDV